MKRNDRQDRTTFRGRISLGKRFFLTMGIYLAVSGILVAEGGREEVPAQSPRVRWMAYHSYRRELSTVKRFGELGIDVVTCFPANNLSSVGVPYSPYPPIWIGPQMYDYACLNRQITDLLEANPRARIVVEIDLNTPPWWPRWLGAAAERDDSFTKLGKVAAHPGWRQETRAYLQAVLKHLEDHYLDRIIAYVLTCGMTLEWQDMARGEESASRRRAWREWMQRQGFPDPVDIPPASIREHLSHGSFRDPAGDALAIRYWQFNADLIAETIIFYAQAAQEVIRHRVPLGVYYGYWLEHGQGRLLYEGHLGFEKVLRSPDIDFFLAPGTYFDRQLGGAGGFMTCLASIRHHGKGFVHEVDHRTHTAKSVTLLGRPVPGHESGFADEEATIVGLRREFALALIHGTAMWWFDMFGHWYDSPRVQDAIREMAVLWERLSGLPTESVAQIAVFVDSESFFYLDGNAPFYNDLLYRQRFGLARMGAPYDVYTLSDLTSVELSRYRMLIFPNLFVVNAPTRELLRNRVCTNGRTIVWVYAPGIICDGRYDPSAVESLTGVPFNAAELTVRNFDTWRSVFVPKPNISAQTLRELARQAGVHIYCERDEVLYVNNRFVALHSATPGRKTILLPRSFGTIRELFTDEVVGTHSNEIIVDNTAPVTVLFQLEDAEAKAEPSVHEN